MQLFVQLCVDGLTLGCMYALIALGYSMVYGVLRMLNFAHGDLYMIGAFAGYYVLQWAGGPSAPGIPVPLLVLCMFAAAAVGSAGLGVVIERFAYRPLRKAPSISALVSSLGVSFLLQSAAILFFGAQARSYDTDSFLSFHSGVHLGALNISLVRILTIVVATAAMISLTVLVRRTSLGRNMRAVAADRDAAEMLGISVNHTVRNTFMIGSALAGVAGVMSGLVFGQAVSNLGYVAGLKAFTGAVVGGIGNIPGAMLGGLVIGMAESFTTGYISSTYSNQMVFGLLILVLVLRPSGLLGNAVVEKV
jgi:branched-chain amino acid transport system permease protein